MSASTFERAIGADVVPCFRAVGPDFEFGHGWATEIIDERPVCDGCADWHRRRRTGGER